MADTDTARKRARFERPWDSRRNHATEARKRFQKHKEAQTFGDFIEVQGQRFYSDRFYLNRTISNGDNDEAFEEEPPKGKCTCGAREAPPLFDRAALVASLDLKAAILATYTVEKDSLQQEFPSLFSEKSTVPTIVLHGRKVGNDEEKEVENDSDYEEDSPHQHDVIDSGCKAGLSPRRESTDNFSVSTQTSDTKEHAALWGNEQSPCGEKHCFDRITSFPSHVYFTEIKSYWIPPSELPSTVVNTDGSVCDEIVQKRKFKKGVHHPKFMLLFEKSGSIVVLVSTANLTSPCTTDATWLQRVAPLQTSTGNNPLWDRLGENCNPGRILGHVMDCQTWAAPSGRLTPLGFGKKYLGWKKSCQDLASGFDFSKCQVFLVPHVPGDHMSTSSLQEKSAFRYGRQFVSHVLECLMKHHDQDETSKTLPSLRPWLPSSILSDQDRLIIQPTSVGGEWTPKDMSVVVTSFLGEQSTDEEDADDANTSSLDRLDIVWPTDDFVRAVSMANSEKGATRSTSPNSVVVQTGFLQSETARRGETGRPRRSEGVNEGYLFMSSETFNSVHIDCLSRMVMFEPSSPLQMVRTHIPHIKSVARLFGGKRYRIQKDFGMGKSEEYFPWFLLTSACLSRGTQGIENATGIAHGRKNTVAFTNFELGVLFCSRLQRKSKSDRLYCWNPARCSCPSPQTEQQPNLIHLPIPYDLRPASYHEHVEDMDFCETPYFNEIVKGTGCTGHMKLTPLGASLGH